MCKEFMYENKVYLNDRYITFNIIDLNRAAKTITVNITDSGRHTVDTFELYDLVGWTYFEYGRPMPERIYVDDFAEVA